jgi:hypothetical protein
MEAEKMCTNYLIVLVQRMATQGSDGWFVEGEIVERVHWKRMGGKAGHASPMSPWGDAVIR